MFQVDLSDHYCLAFNPKDLLIKLNSKVINDYYEKSETFKVLIKTLANRFQKNKDDRVYKTLSQELEFAIERINNFENYLMLFEQITTYLSQNKIFANVGQGAEAGSLVCYGLGITKINPLDFNLNWRRFYGKSLCLDIEIPRSIHKQLESFLQKKYPGKIFALATRTNYTMKDATNKILNKYKWSFKQIAEVNQILDTGKNEKPSLFNYSSIRKPSNFLDFYNNSDQLKEIFKDRESIILEIFKLMDKTHNYSIHKSSLLIPENNVTQYLIPGLFKNKLKVLEPEAVTQEGTIEVNLLNSEVLDRINQIIIDKKIDFDLLKYLRLDDSRIFDAIHEYKDKTTALPFYQSSKLYDFFNGYGKDFEIRSIEDFAIYTTIFRTASMEKIDYRIPGELPIRFHKYTQETNGHLLYQEQILFFLVDHGLHDANRLLKELMRGQRNSEEEFLEELSQEELDILFKYAKVSFNKSHVIANSVLTYLDILKSIIL